MHLLHSQGHLEAGGRWVGSGWDEGSNVLGTNEGMMEKTEHRIVEHRMTVRNPRFSGQDQTVPATCSAPLCIRHRSQMVDKTVIREGP